MVSGVVQLIQGQILLGVVCLGVGLVVGLVVGPGGYSIVNKRGPHV